MSKKVNKFKYRYTVFGLKILSDIMIQELITTEDGEDVVIEIGKVPAKIENVIDYADDYQISKTEFLFSIENVARYYVKNGSLIIVEPFENSDNNTVKTYLMGTAMGTLLLQRGMMPIHGSCVVMDHCCVIFTGASGAGKSSLCSAFRKSGYRFLSDDVSVITVNEEGVVAVQPAFPQQRLCTDTAQEMGFDVKTLDLASIADKKYVINNVDDFNKEPVPLVAIFNISTKNYCDVELIKLKGMEKLQNFIENIYCNVILMRQGVSPIYFNECLTIAKKIEFYNLFRPVGIFTVKKQMELVMEAHRCYLEA